MNHGQECVNNNKKNHASPTSEPTTVRTTLRPRGCPLVRGLSFLPGAAWIDKLDATGASVQQWTGLTLVTDVEFGEDGSMYAVEFARTSCMVAPALFSWCSNSREKSV